MNKKGVVARNILEFLKYAAIILFLYILYKILTTSTK